MQWLISFGLLTAVLGWLFTVLHRLHHLHRELSQSWAQWVRHTRRRNAALRNFTRLLSLSAQEAAPTACELERLADASDRRLEGNENDAQGLALQQGEAELECRLSDAIDGFRLSPQLSTDDQLVELCAELCLAMKQQMRSTRAYNTNAATFNDALTTPSARLAAPLLGYQAVQQI